MIVLLLGPPGSGKGTQANVLARRLGLPHISTGEILRAEVARDSALGQEAAPFMNSGELVPDELMVRTIGARLSEPDAAGGALLDGFPRTVPQARTLDAMLRHQGLTIDAVVSFDVPEDLLRERILRRAAVESRSDDTADAFHIRMQRYRAETAPCLDYYRDVDTPVALVDGVGEVETVTDRVQSAIAASAGGERVL